MPPPPKSPYVTQKDIARLANVSQSAVAAALGRTDKIRVSSETRSRVLQAAAQLNYTPNRFASITRSGRSRQVAIIARGTMLQSVFHRLRHLANFLHEQGFTAVPQELDWTSRTLEQAWDDALASRAEGIILSSSFGVIPASVHRKLLNSPVPTISLCGPSIPGLPLLAPDLRAAFGELTRSLIHSGRRNLVLLKGRYRQKEKPTLISWKRAERTAGFLDAVREFDLEKSCPIVEVEKDINDRDTLEHEIGERGLTQILSENGGRPPEVVVCTNDNFALGVISEATRRGIQIPRDMAVTGCDGEDWTGFGAVPITTIVQPAEALARAASELLCAMLEGKPASVEQTLLPCEIVWRQSCARSAGSAGKRAVRPVRV